jgi:hypothetical protein
MTQRELERSSFLSYGKLSQAIVLADRELGVERGPYFGWGGPITANDLLEPLSNLGLLLIEIRPEFTGMPDVPATIDVERRSEIEALRKMVEDATTDAVADPTDC